MWRLAKTGLTVAWVMMGLGEWWVPVRLLIVATGLLIALSTADAVKATRDESVSMLGTALAEATRRADLQPVLRGVPRERPEAKARLAFLPERPGHAGNLPR